MNQGKLFKFGLECEVGECVMNNRRNTIIASVFIFIFLGSNFAMLSNIAIINIGPRITIAELGSDTSTREFRKSFNDNNLLQSRISYEFVDSPSKLNRISSTILIVVGHGSNKGVLINGKIYDWSTIDPHSKLTILAMCFSNNAPIDAIKFPGIVDARLAAIISKIILLDVFGYHEEANELVLKLIKSNNLIDWLIDPQYPLGTGDWTYTWNPSAMLSYKFLIGLGVVGLLGILYYIIKPEFGLSDLAYAIICYLLDAVMDIVLYKIPDALSIVKDAIKDAVKALVGAVFYYFVGPASEGFSTFKSAFSAFLKTILHEELGSYSAYFKVVQAVYAILYYILRKPILKKTSEFYGECSTIASSAETANNMKDKLKKLLKKDGEKIQKAANELEEISIPLGALMAYKLAGLGETIASVISDISNFIFKYDLGTHGFHMQFSFYFKFHYYELVDKHLSSNFWLDKYTFPSFSSIFPESSSNSGSGGGSGGSGGGGRPPHLVIR